MAKAKFYIILDTYWQNSKDTFFGPYASRKGAENAVKDSGAGRWDRGQMARDVKHQTRCLGILTTTEARRQGMTSCNTLPAVDTVPGDVQELGELGEEMLVW